MRASPAYIAFVLSLVVGIATLTSAFSPVARSSSAQLQVFSQPTGAMVFLDGKEIGQTPLKRDLPGGKHRLQLKLSGYAHQDLDLFWPSDQSQTIYQRLNPILGKLTVKDANKARLLLGPGIFKELKGTGPWALLPGYYQLTASRGQLPSKPVRFEIKPDQTLEVTLAWPAVSVPYTNNNPKVRSPASSGHQAMTGQQEITAAEPRQAPRSIYRPRPTLSSPVYPSSQVPSQVRPTQTIEPIFTPIPPSHSQVPTQAPHNYPGGDEPLFTPLP